VAQNIKMLKSISYLVKNVKTIVIVIRLTFILYSNLEYIKNQEFFSNLLKLIFKIIFVNSKKMFILENTFIFIKLNRV